MVQGNVLPGQMVNILLIEETFRLMLTWKCSVSHRNRVKNGIDITEAADVVDICIKQNITYSEMQQQPVPCA